MLLIPPPFAPTLPLPGAPPNVVFTTYTGRLLYWEKTRMAAPPTSGPLSAQTLLKNRQLTTLNLPPLTHIAPPPSYTVSFLELPFAKVRFCTVRCGLSWFWQCDVVQCWLESQVFMYRMRVVLPPESVTSPPPSITMSCIESLKTFAGRVSVMVNGAVPPLKTIFPPEATAAMNASGVQLSGVPVPIT